MVASGCQANTVAAMVLAQKKGDALLVGDQSHFMGYERGSISSIANVLPVSLPTADNGELDLAKIEYHASIPNNEHTPGITAIALESSHNGCNGRVLSTNYIS